MKNLHLNRRLNISSRVYGVGNSACELAELWQRLQGSWCSVVVLRFATARKLRQQWPLEVRLHEHLWGVLF